MKIQCRCGSLIYDGGDDLPHKAHIIPDQRWNALFEEIDNLIEHRCGTKAQREAACTKLRGLIGTAARQAWQCASCGRIYADDAAHKLNAYAPDATASRSLFRAT